MSNSDSPYSSSETLSTDSAPGSGGIRFKLFVMMVLEFFIWGAWLPLIFGSPRTD
ncbi:MAG: hypothetical protein U0892_16670 [Pirellulales bacterium]